MIAKLAEQHPITVLCRTLGVARSGYDAWATRGESARVVADRQLLEEIRQLHVQSKERLGSEKTWHMLRKAGVKCGRHRVARLRRENGIFAKRRLAQLRKRAYTMTSPPAPDRLQRDFTAQMLNQIWVGDLTYIRTREGWLYLAVILDLYSRKVIGWSMDSSPKEAVHTNALKMALTGRRPGAGLIHHSDRGVQYRSRKYLGLLAKHEAITSMNGTSFPQDNAVAESFFATLKNELVHYETFETRDEARLAIVDYIEAFYNRYRIHQSLGYKTPDEVERNALSPNDGVH